MAADPLLSFATLPFGNLSDYRGRLLDRRAAAAVAAEAPAPWEALGLATVQQALEDLHAPWPLETADVQRLCAQLEVAVAVTGVIRQVQVQSQGAQVTLQLEVIEPLSGETVGRAQGQGKFQSREPLAVDARVDEALQQAASAAWRALGPPPTVVGWVEERGPGERLTVTLAEKVRLPAKAVLLLLPPPQAPTGPPLAAVKVEKVTPDTAQVQVLGRRGEMRAGAVAMLIGRLS